MEYFGVFVRVLIGGLLSLGHAGAAGLVSLLGSDGGRRRPTTWDRLRAIQGGTTARISETAKENLVEGFDDNKVPSL